MSTSSPARYSMDEVLRWKAKHAVEQYRKQQREKEGQATEKAVAGLNLKALLNTQPSLEDQAPFAQKEVYTLEDLRRLLRDKKLRMQETTARVRHEGRRPVRVIRPVVYGGEVRFYIGYGSQMLFWRSA